MEYVPGKTLRESLDERQIKISTAVEIALQIAHALGAAHAEDIVHRDIKPENIILRQRAIATEKVLVKVLDFGLAKLGEKRLRESTSSFETVPGLVMGTTAYMSPEQLRGEAIDERTDLWSLGVILYEMINGKRPFEGNTASDVQAAILLKEPEPLDLETKLPALNRIIEKALSKNIATRYQSAKEIIHDLRILQRQAYDYLQPNTNTNPNQNEATAVINRNSDKHKTITKSHTVPRGKYIAGGIENHKSILAVSLSILLLALSGLGYWVFTNRTAPAKQIESIAVLPFVSISNDPNTEFLSKGISESLINNLSPLPGIKVTASSSSSKFKGKETYPQEVANALGVQAIVVGKVAQSGDNLLINVELVNAHDKTQIWGEQYTRKASDLLQVQSAISKEIAEKLHIRLTGAQRQRMTRGETTNPQAYELVLKSKIYNGKGGRENMNKSLESLNQAITLDPNYALAYALLSIAYRNLVDQSFMKPEDGMPKAESAAYKALELDENLAESHFALATIKRDKWQWQESEREFKRAIELNPNLSRAHSGYASYLRLMKRHDEAIAEIKIARELDPLSPIVNANVSWTLYLARRYDEAIEAIQKELEIDHNNPDAHYILGYIYMAKGMFAEAIKEYQETIKLGLDIPGPHIYQGVVYARQGETEQARKFLKQLQTSKEYVSPGELAILYAALNDYEQAFAALEKAYSTHDLQLQTLAVDAAYDPLRSDPRFQDLLRRIGLPQ
jgi:serine/threonine protein kinase/Flp pilus assembly protein TadD